MALEGLDDRGAIVEQDVDPHVGAAGGQARGVAGAGAERDAGEPAVGERLGQRGRHRLRQMAGPGELPVVRRRVDQDRLGLEHVLPEPASRARAARSPPGAPVSQTYTTQPAQPVGAGGGEARGVGPRERDGRRRTGRRGPRRRRGRPPGALTLQTSVRSAPGSSDGPQPTDKIQRGLRGNGQHHQLGAAHGLGGRVGQLGDRGGLKRLHPVRARRRKPTTRGTPASRACHASDPPMAPRPMTASDDGRTSQVPSDVVTEMHAAARMRRRLPPWMPEVGPHCIDMATDSQRSAQRPPDCVSRRADRVGFAPDRAPHRCRSSFLPHSTARARKKPWISARRTT